MKTSISNDIKSVWLSPDGNIYESSYQNHVRKICDIFNINYKPNNSLIYYRIAFFHGYIKLSITDDELNIQLTKPATKKQKRVILDMYRTLPLNIFIEYNTHNTQVFSESYLLNYLSGNLD